MLYTIKQLADLAGVTVRTLHHYDQIHLLKPSQVAKNGYRYYAEAEVMRLQQILFYREMGLELAQIKAILDNPNFDSVEALRSHRASLLAQKDRLNALIETLDNTLDHLSGARMMSKKELFRGFTPEEQKEIEREVRLQYDPAIVKESFQRWGSYAAVQREVIMEEGNALYAEIATAIDAQRTPDSPHVQDLLVRWHKHIRYFYEPTLEILRGLGELYNMDERFKANFDRLHPNLAEYMREAITVYVDALEYAEIVQMLADDDTHADQQG